MRVAAVVAALFFVSSLSARDVYLSIAGSVGVFRTDTRIFNPSGTKDIVITAAFLPLGQDNTTPVTREITIRSREMAAFDDVVGSLFGGSGLGAIRLSSPDEFLATSRIYATAAAGTLGQFVPGLDVSAAKQKGLLLQLKATSAFRTNMGFVNPNPTATTVTVRTYDHNNALAGAPSSQTIPPFSAIFPIPLDPAKADFSNAWVAYEASQPIFAFGSVIDNGTTDATFIPAFEDTAPRNWTVLFDQGHHSAHSVLTTYATFARLLREDGWIVESSNTRFDPAMLQRARVLVIVNALNQINLDNWTLPTPSAFTAEEIAAVRAWVEEGGSLLLIADHMPFPGAAGDLAAVFGIRFSNGFAFDTRQLSVPNTCLNEQQVQIFRKSEGTLLDHPITSGIESVGTFTGSAFQTEGNGTPLMVFGPNAISLTPQTAWEFPSSTPRPSVAAWYQGAVLKHGKGRVAVFGEAAMFTEQTCGPGRPMGMNSPAAQHNSRLLVNVIRWLGGQL
jgi:hypothetical protein